MIMDVMEIQKIIPHRYPFLLLDRVTDIVKNETLVGFKNVTIGDNIFQGHFPGHPIYPGVMILEGMAQAGGILAFKSMDDMTEEEAANKVVYFMSIDKAKFRSPVRPGDRLEYRISVIKRKGSIWMLDGKAYVDDVLVSQAELKAMIVDK
ncbi:MAG: 3-hydroxyacyl-ACP dehydratase FabZ [Epsilonproteobacteria bacterium]|nr:3-hydroxyacyl-ACP dehydratase FabZ [Campylobacterota bacterium]OIO17482.1 MAG: 3-hydroxyacyl-[acyl-carrier-protein] dehydratase FabZ [Helicobacteraceae bacterium CG1_02_36_14]PIP10723.1 MAG: 3-hydroxyacyl-[acyl-carrier-protein] dehydratase FabZ [Sulfurimonas sp. CG23_combo_of_CG06-09_8_20_14_all_36_33]PIS25057.1 MAG: 3-hydroxyacyl-[acyl-carrier-protein] dehydratase FabZ [Sulfurimonas sp. CG08_land_8_20_14_0_20_36_33]PIU35187.1 MAG: 3-hydroxyacyl-[acyl-carrier-protein] dehydratase FabZ [Sulfu